MFMCRSLEEFRETYLCLLHQEHQQLQPPPAPDGATKAEPEDSDNSDQSSHYRMVTIVKREEFWLLVSDIYFYR